MKTNTRDIKTDTSQQLNKSDLNFIRHIVIGMGIAATLGMALVFHFVK